MADCYTGEIRAFAFSYPPTQWAQCNGQLVSITQNPALYSILGTMYGGDGKNTFGLPNLNGRVVVGTGTSPTSGTVYTSGGVGGVENVTLNNQQTNHSHTFNAAVASSPVTKVTNVPATTAPGSFLSNMYEPHSPNPLVVRTYLPVPQADIQQLNGAAISPLGGNGAHSNMQPSVAINYCICLYGEEYPVKP
ncbi:phage tail protein [Mucilaginibacter jinjuensis]|uniref:Tail fiber protein n=1 Tax=Mucilaginibacter jinjuensis TaxID=1176721 RepID=A0ABY7T6D2_9SPHI|nr:tail fiber protein [Mucilaginibacter jinjuensis]WCT11941.1 tail fiber protein [Mucilaginibacter jinjuensis]